MKKRKKRGFSGAYSADDVAKGHELLEPMRPDYHWLSAPFRYSLPLYCDEEKPGNQFDFSEWSLREIFLFMMKDAFELARIGTDFFGSRHYAFCWKELDNKRWYTFIAVLIHMDSQPKFSAEEHFKQPIHPRLRWLEMGYDEFSRIIRAIRLYDCAAKKSSGESVSGHKKYDPLFKIRDYLNTTIRGFQAARTPPSPHMALDEEVAYCKVTTLHVEYLSMVMPHCLYLGAF